MLRVIFLEAFGVVTVPFHRSTGIFDLGGVSSIDVIEDGSSSVLSTGRFLISNGKEELLLLRRSYKHSISIAIGSSIAASRIGRRVGIHPKDELIFHIESHLSSFERGRSVVGTGNSQVITLKFDILKQELAWNFGRTLLAFEVLKSETIR